MKVKAPKWRQEERFAAILGGATALVDKHGAWRAHLSRTLQFPFMATFRGGNGVEPFTPGAVVQVIGISHANQGDVGVLGKVMDGQRSVLIPLELLSPRESSQSIVEAVSDWRVWSKQNA